jgi:hypothetical protein
MQMPKVQLKRLKCIKNHNHLLMFDRKNNGSQTIQRQEKAAKKGCKRAAIG